MGTATAQAMIDRRLSAGAQTVELERKTASGLDLTEAHHTIIAAPHDLQGPRIFLHVSKLVDVGPAIFN